MEASGIIRHWMAVRPCRGLVDLQKCTKLTKYQSVPRRLVWSTGETSEGTYWNDGHTGLRGLTLNITAAPSSV